MRTLSIIILSYNTESITRDCLNSLVGSIAPYPQLRFEIVVVDNASSDNSPQLLTEFQNKPHLQNITVKTILNDTNEGFPKGNNRGVRASSGDYILFLNSDVIVGDINWSDILDHLEKNPRVGVLTVRVNLPNTRLDPASHRGFPTLWNSFCYYAGLERLSRYIPFLSAAFGGYHLTQYPLDTPHEIDSPSGAFYLTRRALFEDVGGFDEDYFMYGEDLDLSYRIKQQGFKILFYPQYTVLHLKHQSGLKKKRSAVHSKTKQYFYDAMKIFYKKHYAAHHSSLVNNVIYSVISLKSKI